MKVTKFVTRDRVTRICGLARSPRAFDAFEKKLGSIEHRIFPSRTEQLQCRSTANLNMDPKGSVGTGHKVWSITRQATVLVTPDGKRHVLFVFNARRTKPPKLSDVH
jgi:hypothetical protein